MNRKSYFKKNTLFGYFNVLIQIILAFIMRSVFLNHFEVEYLGINGYFSNIISILSFADLGIGVAITSRLYKLVANNDYDKIYSYINLFKKINYFIAGFIFLTGLFISPFIINSIQNSSLTSAELYIIYNVFLLNSCLSFFVNYKYSLALAEQKNYIQTIDNLKSTLFLNIIQISFIILFGNYLLFLIIGLFSNIIFKIYFNIQLNIKYPSLKSFSFNKLDADDLKSLKKDVFSLIIHKFGEISVNQTDNIIIGTIIGISFVGLISNYSLLFSYFLILITTFFTFSTTTIGNYIAVESLSSRVKLFNTFRHIGFILFSFFSLVLLNFSSDFISVWLGKEFVLDSSIIIALVYNQFLLGDRVVLNIFKVNASLFKEDRFLPLFQAIINLTISIFGAIHLGLIGVYLGTLISGIFMSIFKPIFLYKKLFNQSYKEFFLPMLKNNVFFLGNFVFYFIGFFSSNSLLELIQNFIIFSLIYILLYFVFYIKDQNFILLHEKLKRIIKNSAS